MIVAEDVRTADGALLLARRQVVSDSLVERVRNMYRIAATRQRVRFAVPNPDRAHGRGGESLGAFAPAVETAILRFVPVHGSPASSGDRRHPLPELGTRPLRSIQTEPAGQVM